MQKQVCLQKKICSTAGFKECPTFYVMKSVCSKMKCQIDGSRSPVVSKCQKFPKKLVQPDSEPEDESESESENELDADQEI